MWDDDEAARQEGEMTMRDGEALAAEGTLAGLEAEEAGVPLKLQAEDAAARRRLWSVGEDKIGREGDPETMDFPLNS